MSQIKELLIDQLQDLLSAETQLTQALPKMAEAAHHPKLKESFEKHLSQTEGHVHRLKQIFGILGGKPASKQCKAMKGLVEEGQETIQEGKQKEAMTADLALIAAAQRVEHYEIAAYGTAKSLARQLGEFDCALLLSHTLGEEEAADFLLTGISQPIMQQMSLDDMNGNVDLETVGVGPNQKSAPTNKKAGRKSQAQ